MSRLVELATAASNPTIDLTTWGVWINDKSSGWKLAYTSIDKTECGRFLTNHLKDTKYRVPARLDIYELSPETKAFQEYMKQP